MATQNFGYEYHSGANCIIAINDAVIAEVVGISYNVMDSMAPIYGYSSRLFDAVAPGQKLVQGSFVINYTKPNYIYTLAKLGAQKTQDLLIENEIEALKQLNDESLKQELQNAAQAEKAKGEILKEMSKGNKQPEDTLRKIQAQQNFYWGEQENTSGERELVAKDPTLIGPTRLEIFFGGDSRRSCKHMVEIHGVFIIGHASAIQIDENVILEEYNFIGRDLVQLQR